MNSRHVSIRFLLRDVLLSLHLSPTPVSEPIAKNRGRDSNPPYATTRMEKVPCRSSNGNVGAGPVSFAGGIDAYIMNATVVPGFTASIPVSASCCVCGTRSLGLGKEPIWFSYFVVLQVIFLGI
jgi:hypothetical protein